MDEQRVGLKPILSRRWAERGKAPTVCVQHRYDWLDVSAFVCPQTNQSWLLPSVNTPAFQAVLDRFARDTGAGSTREIVLVLDGAPLKNRHFPTLDALTERLAAQCQWLEGQCQRVRSLTLFHWWPRVTD